MKPSIQKLQKFFRLEAERGYDNRAVLGGLERILDAWEADARLDQLPEDLIQAVRDRLLDYGRLSTTSRAESLEGLWRRVQRSGEAPLPPEAASAERAPAERAPAEKGSQPEAGQPAQRAPGAEEAREAQAAPAKKEAQLPGPRRDEPEPSGEEALKPAPIRPSAPGTEAEGAPAARQEGQPGALNAPVTVLPGVGPRNAQTLSHLGMRSLRDMLYYFPRRYDDYSQLKPINRLWYGEEVTVIGTVQQVTNRPIRSGRMQVTEAVISDGSGALRVTWFNQPWVGKRLRGGTHIAVAGKIDQYLGRLVMNSPEWEPLEQQQLSTNRIVPVYSLTANITQRWLRRLMNQVVTYWAPRIQDPLPEPIRRSAGLVDLPTALLQAHFPDSVERLKAARHRLAFDEIFLLQLGVLRQKQSWQERTGRVFETAAAWLESQVERLPFELTGAQQRAIQDVNDDLASGHPMNRLLQGDVGSGKTVIAALAVAIVTRAGAQAALMAPTSILAEQHYKSMLQLLAGEAAPVPAAPQSGGVMEEEAPDQAVDAPAENAPQAGAAVYPSTPATEPPLEAEFPDQEAKTPAEGVPQAGAAIDPSTPAAEPPLKPEEIRLLVGATPEAEKREIRAGLADGSIKLVVGTHALIEDPVVFSDLQLTIVDEQHRFGVEQRAALRSKGDNPHLLVMTATPIPRSLALTVYGDLDLSVMDEMPPGRQAVGTYLLTPLERERVYGLIRSQIEQGRQAFIIYPLIDGNDNGEVKAAVEEHTRLQAEVFPRLQIGLLHGRLKPEEKDEVMSRFRSGAYHVLVSTSVVEVGVDVPNATVMVIEGANHFGLAQLHQFRGRVGRGGDKAYCVLIPDTADDAENERLKVMTETNDGFLLAQKDLEQRGPGEFLGTRQSGAAELQLANLTDVELIEKARRQAQALFEQDRNLEKPEHQILAADFERFWSGGKGDIS